MSKKNLAKRLIALVAIVAMFAAMTVTASAADYSSTTMYVDDNTVKVSTYVKGLTTGDEVTYYAKSGVNDVYVNQYTAEGSTLDKDYITDTANLDGLEIKMAKVDSEFSNYAKIEGSDKGSVTFVWGSLSSSYSDNFPVADEIITIGNVSATADSKLISSLTAKVGDNEINVPAFINENGNVSIINPFTFTEADGTVTVTWNGGTYSAPAVGINLTSDFGYTPVQSVVFNKNKIYFKDSYTFTDEDGEDVTGKLFAVLYDVKLPNEYIEVGIEIDEGKGDGWVPLKAYGTLAGDTQKFAIALVDEALEYGFKYRAYCKISETETVYDTAVKIANAKYAEEQ
ncbi:MAG: hypothetical protein E7396_03960 [Ruminococcaceae bacterium]|nr:hypothetical protein [Oscillospiraceae bacterium]